MIFAAPSRARSPVRNFFPSGPRPLLQRKCACGGTPGPSGECEACRTKREGAKNSAAASGSARFGHDFSRMPVHRARITASGGGKNSKNGEVLQRAPAAAVPEKELLAEIFFGDAELKEVRNRRKLLRSGSSGDAVMRVQEALLAEGYELPKFGADGKFGAETARAVREFQQRWRMSVDGIVGDQTLGLLDDHLVLKDVLAAGEQIPLVGGLVKRAAASALDQVEEDRRKTACPAANKAERLTACIQPVVITNDDGSAPTAAPSFIPSQRIWEKCCNNLSVLGTKTVKKTDFKTLDESPTDVPTAEESALFTAAGASSCVQVFIPENLEQAGVIGKNVSGGGATYGAGTANPKVIAVEGAVPEVVAHEIGHAFGASHDAANTVMKPTGAHDAANSPKVSLPVCADARTGAALSKTSGSKDCCMFPN